MPSIAPDYLDRLGIARNVSEEELEKLLAAQEARCQVLLKIPTKKSEAANKLELIKVVKGLLVSAPMVDGSFDFPTDDEPELTFNAASSKNNNRSKPKLDPIFESNKITDEGERGKLRALLNQWANSIPHHEYLTFGTDINILEVEERPIYLIDLKYLLEQRQIVAKEKAYAGEGLPANGAISVAQVSMWNIKIPNPVGYDSGKAEKEVSASRQVIDCPTCETQGEMWCTACRSTGQVVCLECTGKYQFNCPTCDGKGQVERNRRLEDCRQCRGVGIAVCGYCREGLATCGTCKGYRKISCQPCNGKGQLLKYLSISTSYQPKTASATILPTTFPDYARKYFNGEQEKNIVFSQEGERYANAKPINDIKYSLVRDKIINLIEQNLINNLPAETQVNKHSISVRQCPATYLSYSFLENNYELWVVGTNPIVFCRTSPIHEYDKKLAQLAKEQLVSDNFVNCLELLSLAFLHTPNSSSALVVVNEAVKKLQELLKKKNYYQVLTVANQAEKFLGDYLGVSFKRLGQEAALNMRLEYGIASFATGIGLMFIVYIVMGFTGQYYARSFMVEVSIVLVILATALSWVIAPQLATQVARGLIASLISFALVIGTSVFGSIQQDEYLTQRKEEINARFGKGDYQSSKASIEPLESLVELFPADLQVRLMLGHAYVKATYYEKAIQTLNVALALTNGKTPEVYNELGLALLGKGEKQAAIKNFRQAIKLRLPDKYREAYQNLARALGMVYIEGSIFGMGRGEGNTLEGPVHNVTVEGFFIDQFEVTNQEYLEFIEATKYIAPRGWENGKPLLGKEKMPVTGVSLADAKAFAQWRKEKTGFAYRIPKEAEWELAARGAKGRIFPWGLDWNQAFANIKASEGRLSPVGSFTQGATPEGVEDLLGNAAELVDDELKPYPGGRVLVNGSFIVVRGGAYDNVPNQITATTRAGVAINNGDYHNIGFRCVISIEEIEAKK